MDRVEKEIRQRIAETLGDMAESILRREAPLDRLPLQPEATSEFHRKYLQYFDEIEESLREKVITRAIDHARHRIRELLLGFKHTVRFYTEYPQHHETEKAFREWIAQKEGPRQAALRHLPPPRNIKVNQIVKKIMRQRKPEFSYDKTEAEPGAIPFSKPWLDNNKVYIIPDRGTKREFLDFTIGIEYPKFYCDIANFFARGQSWYDYETEEDVVKAVNRALDLIDLILPHFLDRVKKVLEEYGDKPS